MTFPQKYLNHYLGKVEKPSRFIGGELNTETHSSTCKDSFCIAFPEPYELAMSHLGHRLIFGLLNEMNDIDVHRAYMPPPDVEKYFTEDGLKLASHGSGNPLKTFNAIGFTLSWELSLTNVLAMLDLAGIPLAREDRKEDDPVIIAGGPVTANPAPLTTSFDAIFVGEAEPILKQMIDAIKCSTREERLSALAKIKGFYVPGYNNGADRVFAETLEDSPFVTAQPVPYCRAVHDRGILEIQRGCPNGCRFCQAGYLYRPVRVRKVDTIINQAEKLVDETGYDEISLSSLSSADHPDIEQLAIRFMEKFSNQRISLSLPSLRVDHSTMGVYKIIGKVQKTGLTFALEAAREELRDRLNKGIKLQDLMDNLEVAFANGWDRVKLYFMNGLPGETDEDLIAIPRLCRQIAAFHQARRSGKRSRPLSMNVTISTFIPKPHTPFQWEKQADMEEVRRMRSVILDSPESLNHRERKNIKLSFNEPSSAYLEGILARGDEKVGKAALEAYRFGASRDGWREHLNMEAWSKAFDKIGVDPSIYLLAREGVLPWDNINPGINRAFLEKERDRADKVQLSSGCTDGCKVCGVC